jgi:hypothetical protein
MIGKKVVIGESKRPRRKGRKKRGRKRRRAQKTI